MSVTECIFCQIVQRRSPASFVYEDERVVAFMDIQPVNPGHLLVIPRAHAASLAELAPGDGGRMFQVAQGLAAALRRSQVRCEGINFFLADGEAAGQDVFHVHLHVLSRFAGDGFGFTFNPSYYDLPSRGELNRIAEEIRRNR